MGAPTLRAGSGRNNGSCLCLDRCSRALDSYSCLCRTLCYCWNTSLVDSRSFPRRSSPKSFMSNTIYMSTFSGHDSLFPTEQRHMADSWFLLLCLWVEHSFTLYNLERSIQGNKSFSYSTCRGHFFVDSSALLCTNNASNSCFVGRGSYIDPYLLNIEEETRMV